MSKQRDINRVVHERIASRPSLDTDPDNPRETPLSRLAPTGVFNGPASKSTFVGMQGASLVQSLGAKLKALEAQVESGDLVLSLDPKRIRHSEHNTRDKRSLDVSDPEFAALLETVRQGGVNQPIQVRPVHENPNADYEVVTGHRRHAAALIVDREREAEGGFKLRALVAKGATDPAELVRLMHLENSARKDMSPYEYGLLYADALKMKEYPTQEALAKRLGTSAVTIYYHIALIGFPEEVLQAFDDRRQISVRWVTELSKALKERREHVLEVAKQIVARGEPLPAEQVKTALVAPIQKPTPEKPLERYEQTIRRADKKTVFAKLTRDGRTLRITAGPNVENAAVARLTKLISTALLEAQRQEENADEQR
jgi:ParB family transcriptional regulator, chromosome partitioning protein